jgi:hypothetical protein
MPAAAGIAPRRPLSCAARTAVRRKEGST